MNGEEDCAMHTHIMVPFGPFFQEVQPLNGRSRSSFSRRAVPPRLPPGRAESQKQFAQEFPIVFRAAEKKEEGGSKAPGGEDKKWGLAISSV